MPVRLGIEEDLVPASSRNPRADSEKAADSVAARGARYGGPSSIIPGYSAYGAAKATLRSLVRTLATELSPRGPRVNAVSPGPSDMPAFERALRKEVPHQAKKQSRELIPIKRLGRPEEVAKAVLFLAFDATFTTGAEFRLDGGIDAGVIRGKSSQSNFAMTRSIIVERLETGIPGMVFERNVSVTPDRRPTDVSPDTTRLLIAEGAKVMVTRHNPETLATVQRGLPAVIDIKSDSGSLGAMLGKVTSVHIYEPGTWGQSEAEKLTAGFSGGPNSVWPLPHGKLL